MSEQDKATETEKVACQICLKEIPKYEAKVSEAADYVAYFCGLECYQHWQQEGDKE